jgi:hypothetical protein
MNLPVTQSSAALSFHFLLEENTDEYIVGIVAELPDCRVIAESQEAAIAELEEKLRDRLAKMTVVPFTMPVNSESIDSETEPQRENPWTEFMGMYKDDPVFAEIAAELRAERGLEHLGWVK